MRDEHQRPPRPPRPRKFPPSSPQPVGTLNGRALPDFATLVEQVGPAVVNVSVVEKAQRVAHSGCRKQRRRSRAGILQRFGMPNGRVVATRSSRAAPG